MKKSICIICSIIGLCLPTTSYVLAQDCHWEDAPENRCSGVSSAGAIIKLSYRSGVPYTEINSNGFSGTTNLGYHGPFFYNGTDPIPEDPYDTSVCSWGNDLGSLAAMCSQVRDEPPFFHLIGGKFCGMPVEHGYFGFLVKEVASVQKLVCKDIIDPKKNNGKPDSCD